MDQKPDSGPAWTNLTPSGMHSTDFTQKPSSAESKDMRSASFSSTGPDSAYAENAQAHAIAAQTYRLPMTMPIFPARFLPVFSISFKLLKNCLNDITNIPNMPPNLSRAQVKCLFGDFTRLIVPLHLRKRKQETGWNEFHIDHSALAISDLNA
jgi:hypothetical protein